MFYFIITIFLNTLFSHVKERDCKHLPALTIIENQTKLSWVPIMVAWQK